jgi:uncharacterized membrane protein YjgN (DUF898 family)
MEPASPGTAEAPVPPPRPSIPSQPFEFTGSGDEYFRIWIVNVALSILTLGIYSAWAKVRKLKYFYQHTRVADSGFDYHGQPLAILKGRLIALGLLILYLYSTEVVSTLSVAILIGLAVVLPWLLRSSFRFRLHNSSWRGLRFSFRGTLNDAYVVFLWFGGLGFITGLLWPLFHARLKRYQHGNAWFGQTRGEFTARDGEFYGVYVKASLLSMATIALLGVLMAILVPLLRTTVGDTPDPESMKRAFSVLAVAVVVVMFVAVSIVVGPYITSRTQNLTWNNTRLGPHRFWSTMSARRLIWIYFTNFLAVLATLGFYLPWASVRIARYRASCLVLQPAGSLDEFVAAQEAEVAAAGEEAAEMLDIDIAL